MGVAMNLNIITLPCDQWTKEDWNDAYSQYCRYNRFGVMDKRQYYDFVMGNHKRLQKRDEPLSKELAQKWSQGRRNAYQWAKEHNCLADFRYTEETHSLDDMMDAIKDVQWDLMRLKDIKWK